jgi:hypothetical protein
MTKIATYTVGVGGTASVAFTNIPQTYTDLYVVFSTRDSKAVVEYLQYLQFNYSASGSTNAYAGKFMYAKGTTGSIISAPSSTGTLNGSFYYTSYSPGSSATASVFGNNSFYINGYSGNKNKSVIFEGVTENNATAVDTRLSGGNFNSPEPITSLWFGVENTFVQNSTFTIYGIKAARKVTDQTKKIYVTGGTLTSDSQYYYRTFTSSGTLSISNGNLISDTLIVAGGGSGGGSAGAGYYGGGGGAGGLVAFTNTPLSGDISVTVGAGGTSAAGTNLRGNKGNNSAIGSTTALGGGGGGGGSDSSILIEPNKNGGTGGSGGGGQSAVGTDSKGGGVGGSGTSGQGNSGGSGAGAFQIEPQAGGGGGGAGAAGSNATSAAVGGAGGVGSSAYSSWGLATGTGQLSSGTYYYAGGGGGASNGTGGAAGLGGGGAGGGNHGVAGTANTGGGGGNGVAGGSGIVIIRYTKSQVL